MLSDQEQAELPSCNLLHWEQVTEQRSKPICIGHFNPASCLHWVYSTVHLQCFINHFNCSPNNSNSV